MGQELSIRSANDCTDTINDSWLNKNKGAERPSERSKIHELIARVIRGAGRGTSLRQ